MTGIELGVLAASKWSITNLLTGAGNTLQNWGSLLLVIIGVVMVIAGVYQIAKGLITHGGGRSQTNWAVAILLIILGGAIGLLGTPGVGWQFVTDIAKSGKDTLESLANGETPATILLPFTAFLGI